MLIALWTAGRFFQEEIARAAAKPTAVALAETLQMAGGGASRSDVLELCATVLHVKSGCGDHVYVPPEIVAQVCFQKEVLMPDQLASGRPSTLEAVQLCPDWATFFWAPPTEVSAICCCTSLMCMRPIKRGDDKCDCANCRVLDQTPAECHPTEGGQTSEDALAANDGRKASQRNYSLSQTHLFGFGVPSCNFAGQRADVSKSIDLLFLTQCWWPIFGACSVQRYT